MNDLIRRHPYGSAAVGAILLLLVIHSLVLLIWPPRFETRHFWYPDIADGPLHSEWREVPRRDTAEGAIETYIEDLVLGPVTLGAVPIVPKETRVNTVVLTEDNTLYLDLDRGVLFDTDLAYGSVDDRLALIQRNLRHNFGSLEQIVLTIEGQLPNEPRFTSVGR